MESMPDLNFIPLFSGQSAPTSKSAKAKKLGGGGLPVKARLLRAD